MLVNLYKTQTPLSVFSLPLLVASGCLSLFFRESGSETLCFFSWQTELFAAVHNLKILDFVLATTLLTLNANILNRVFNRNSFYSKDTFLPGLIYVIGMFTYRHIDFSPELLAHFFFILGLSFLLQIKRQEAAKSSVFIGSFFISIGLIFSPLLVPLALLPLISLSIVKPFIWREWVIGILGLALPVLYHHCIYYVINGELVIRKIDVILDAPEVTWTIAEGAIYILISLIGVLGLGRFLLVMRSEIVNFKKLAQIILITLLLCLLSFGVGWYFYNQLLGGFMVPLSFIVSVQVMHSTRKMLPELLILGWFFAALINLYL